MHTVVHLQPNLYFSIFNHLWILCYSTRRIGTQVPKMMLKQIDAKFATRFQVKWLYCDSCHRGVGERRSEGAGLVIFEDPSGFQ